MWPVLFSWGDQHVYAYPLFIGLAWGWGFRLSEARLPADLPAGVFRTWFVGVFVAAWAGAKLLYVLAQDQWAPEALLASSGFWLGGGFVFLGGFLAAAAFTIGAGLITPQLSWRKMSFTVVPLLYAHALGRVGCFLAGCCFGTPTSMPWSVHLHGADRHPVQIYEALGLALLGLTLERISRARLLGAYLLGYGLLRWGLEWWRGDEIRGLWGGMSLSQWVSLGMMAIAIPVIYRTWGTRPASPN